MRAMFAFFTVAIVLAVVVPADARDRHHRKERSTSRQVERSDSRPAKRPERRFVSKGKSGAGRNAPDVPKARRGAKRRGSENHAKKNHPSPPARVESKKRTKKDSAATRKHHGKAGRARASTFRQRDHGKRKRSSGPRSQHVDREVLAHRKVRVHRDVHVHHHPHRIVFAHTSRHCACDCCNGHLIRESVACVHQAVPAPYVEVESAVVAYRPVEGHVDYEGGLDPLFFDDDGLTFATRLSDCDWSFASSYGHRGWSASWYDDSPYGSPIFFRIAFHGHSACRKRVYYSRPFYTYHFGSYGSGRGFHPAWFYHHRRFHRNCGRGSSFSIWFNF